MNSKVIITWASSCDVGPYYGWVMSYDARTLAQTAFVNLAPDGGEAGIWQGDAGPAADKDGSIFVVTGNGKFTAASGGADYGDSVVKLSMTGAALSVRDYFTPFDQQELNSKDLDLGSSGPVLLPDQPGPHPHVLLTSGKGDGVYVIDRDTMGRFHEGSNSHAVQVLKGIGGCFGAPAYWNGSVYYLCSDEVLKQFRLENGLLSSEPAAQGKTKFVDPGATPTVSANGSKDGIVWVIHTHTWNGLDKPAMLFAYDAANVSRELYNSEQIPERDRAGNSLRFAIPTVVNGRVYVGVKGAVEIYGLLPATKKK